MVFVRLALFCRILARILKSEQTVHMSHIFQSTMSNLSGYGRITCHKYFVFNFLGLIGLTCHHFDLPLNSVYLKCNMTVHSTMPVQNQRTLFSLKKVVIIGISCFLLHDITSLKVHIQNIGA